jgi:hypothetical protein
MKNRGSPVDILGPALGVLVVALTVFALVYLVWIQPFHRGGSYRDGHWRAREGFLGAGWESREVTETVAEPIEALTVRNVSGPISVAGWDQDYVQVTYVKEARNAALLDEFQIEIAPRGKELSIQPLYRSARTVAGSAFGSVSFDIRVPSSVRQIKAKSISGRIELQDMPAGVVQDLQTVSGSISTERSGDLRAQSVSGAVDFAFAGSKLELNSTSGRIRGEILALEPGGRVKAQSISGSVELQAFEGLGADLDLSSVSGSISCDFPMQIREQKRASLQGTIGDGAAAFRIHTVSGSIRLSR